MRVPTIHLNGTPGSRLLEQLIEAGNALDAAVQALQGCAPNGRDYYPQGDGALRQAEAEHISRLERIESVRRELVKLAIAIDDAMTQK